MAMGLFQSSGTVTDAYSFKGEINVGFNSGANISNVNGVYSNVNFNGGSSYNVTDSYLFKGTYGGTFATPPANAYGLYLGDINGASALNYSIYTGDGDIRFGDLPRQRP